AGDLNSTLVPAEERADPLLARWREAAGRDLLLRVDLLGRDLALKLVGIPDPAWDERAARHCLGLQHVLLDDLRAGRAGGNIASGDEHVDLVLAVLDVALVVHPVDEGPRRPNRGRNN